MRYDPKRALPRTAARATRAAGVVPTALLAVLLPALLSPPAPRPATAADAKPGGRPADAFDRVLVSAARQTAAYERTRARADRQRRELERLPPDADADRRARAEAGLRESERQLAALRGKLWRELADAQPGLTGTDPALCPLGPRGQPPGKPGGWQAPVRGYRLTAGFAAGGERWRHRHTGQDFAVPAGTPVYAVGPGTVEFATCGDGFGNQVVVRHRDGYFTQYAHLARIDVRPGRRIAAGQRVGLAGATGNATGPHLHFEVRITPYLGSAVDPLPWLRRHGVTV